MWRSTNRDEGSVTVWCVGSVNESQTVDAVAAAKGVRETIVLVRLAVYLEYYYCCGDGEPVGQFRDTVGDGRSGACRAETAHRRMGSHGMLQNRRPIQGDR